jgi:hypothetical protein
MFAPSEYDKMLYRGVALINRKRESKLKKKIKLRKKGSFGLLRPV